MPGRLDMKREHVTFLVWLARSPGTPRTATTPHAALRDAPWQPSPPGARTSGSPCSPRTRWCEDPVGPSRLDPEGKGHHGHEGIGRFWDQNFGFVSRFHFRITDSFANGPCCANIASITMWLGDGGTTMTVDCVVIYTVDDDGRITSIRAHWEPGRAMATLTSP